MGCNFRSNSPEISKMVELDVIYVICVSDFIMTYVRLSKLRKTCLETV